ncbi:hypothetical protein WDU94_015625 [Cyamophila willieti]
MVENHLLYAVKIVYRFATLTCHRCCYYVGEKCSLRSRVTGVDIMLEKNVRYAHVSHTVLEISCLKTSKTAKTAIFWAWRQNRLTDFDEIRFSQSTVNRLQLID